MDVARPLAHLLSSNELVQRVDGSTHKFGNLLDVLITKKYSLLSSKPKLIDIDFSDHKLVTSELCVCRSKPDIRRFDKSRQLFRLKRMKASADSGRTQGMVDRDRNSDTETEAEQLLCGQFIVAFFTDKLTTNKRTKSDFDICGDLRAYLPGVATPGRDVESQFDEAMRLGGTSP